MVMAAGAYRRTQAERNDQRLSWIRADQAFFAAGGCHILAWTCREMYPGIPIGIASARLDNESQVFHTWATWESWAFDHSGWNNETDLLAVNEQYERRPLERIQITTSLKEFCQEHFHRMPHQYWRDPIPRARAYVERFQPPWEPCAGRPHMGHIL